MQAIYDKVLIDRVGKSTFVLKFSNNVIIDGL